MSQNRVAKWVEVNLGDATGGGSDTILRYALGGVDVLHAGNTFKADGNLLAIGNIETTLGFKKSGVSVRFGSANLTNLAHFNAFKYRNRALKVWIGVRGTDGVITPSSIKQIFSGQCDSHVANKRSITLKGKSQFARFEQTAGSRTSSEAQKYNIERGAYDVTTSTVDKGFDFASKDFGDITLGKVPARTVTHSQQVWNGKRGGYFGTGSKKYDTVTTSEYIPGRQGDILGDDGSDYNRPLIFGRASPIGNLIYAFNPSASAVASTYSALANATVVDGVTDTTRYATLVFAIGEGEISDISVIFKGVSGSATSDTLGMHDGDVRFIKTGSQSIAAIEVKTGKYNQTALSSLVSMSPDWTGDHRCIGTALVMITMVASDAFSAGFPDFTFNVGGKLYKTVNSSNNLSSLTSGNTNSNSDIYALINEESGISHTIPAGSSPVSASPAFAILDILMSKVYGLNIPASDIDLASFRNAFNNERDVSSPQVGTYPTTCRGVLEGARSYKQLIDSILAIAKANMTVVDGKITMISNGYLGTDAETLASVKIFDASNTINGIDNINFSPSTQVYNHITLTAPVTNVAGADAYSLNIVDENALIEDDNQKSEKTVSLAMAAVQLDSSSNATDNSKEVLQEIGRAQLRRSRLFVRGTMELDYWTNTTLKPGDVIGIDSKRYNLTGAGRILAKVTRIVFRAFGVMKIEWQQYSNLIWDVAATDITTVTRGVYPTTPFSQPPEYAFTGSAGTSIAVTESSGSNAGDVSTVTFTPDDGETPVTVTIQPGVQGEPIVKVYQVSALEPSVPSASSIPPSGWLSAPTTEGVGIRTTQDGGVIQFSSNPTGNFDQTYVKEFPSGFLQKTQTSRVEIRFFNNAGRTGATLESGNNVTLGLFVSSNTLTLAQKLNEYATLLNEWADSSTTVTVSGNNLIFYSNDLLVQMSTAAVVAASPDNDFGAVTTVLNRALITRLWSLSGTRPNVASDYTWKDLLVETGQEGPAGPAGVNVVSYADLTPYFIGDLVSYSATQWRALKDILSTNTTPPAEDANWSQISTIAQAGGGGSGGDENVQANWTETNTASDAFVRNKPTTISVSQALAITANAGKTGFTNLLAQDALDVSDDGDILTYKDKLGVTQTFQPSGTGEDNIQANWTQTNTSADSFIKNKPTTITVAQANAISANTDKTGITALQANAISANTNKLTYPAIDKTKLATVPALPTGIDNNSSKEFALKVTDVNGTETNTWVEAADASGEANVQANWTETTTTEDAFILNKPTTITVAQATAISANTNKLTYPAADKNKLATIATNADVTADYVGQTAAGNYTVPVRDTGETISKFLREDGDWFIPSGTSTGEVNVQANWTEVNVLEDSFIQNKPTTITVAQANAISANTSRTTITLGQANAISANTNKTGFTDLLAQDALDISSTSTALTYKDKLGATKTFNPTQTGEDNVNANWTEGSSSSDAFIQNKPTTISNTQATAITNNTNKLTYPAADKTKLAAIPELPNSNGDYGLKIISGIGTWTTDTSPAIINDGGSPILGSGITPGELKGLIGANEGFTGGSYDSATGIVTFTSDDNLGFSTTDITGDTGPTGPTGPGWTGGSYNAAAGTVTFLSGDELGFVTGDLRGAASTVAGPAGAGFKTYTTLTSFDIGDVVISGNTQWRVLTAVPASNTTSPAENSTWSELITKSQDQSGGGGGTASSLDTHYATFGLSDTVVGPTNDNGLDIEWFSTPDLIKAPGYTHTSVRRTTHTTEGASTRHQYDVSGNGGGSLTENTDATLSGTAGNSAKVLSADPSPFIGNENGVYLATLTDEAGTTYIVNEGKLSSVASDKSLTLIKNFDDDLEDGSDITDFSVTWSMATDGTTTALIRQLYPRAFPSSLSNRATMYTATDPTLESSWTFIANYTEGGNIYYDGTRWLRPYSDGSSAMYYTADVTTTSNWSSVNNLTGDTGALYRMLYRNGIWVAISAGGKAWYNEGSLIEPTDWIDAEVPALGSTSFSNLDYDGVNWGISLGTAGVSYNPDITDHNGWTNYDNNITMYNYLYNDGNGTWVGTSGGDIYSTNDISDSSGWSVVQSHATTNWTRFAYSSSQGWILTGSKGSVAHLTETANSNASVFTLTVDSQFSSVPITGTVRALGRDVLAAADIRTAINAAITAGTLNDLTVNADSDDVIRLRPTVSGDFDTPALVFTGGGDLSAVVVVDQSLQTGSTASVITIAKTGGERNGSISRTLEISSTIVSQIDDIISDIENSELYLKVIKIDSDTFQLTSIEQEACTITVSLTAGSNPSGSAAVALTVVRAGTDPVITLQGDDWSRPVNSGVAPV